MPAGARLTYAQRVSACRVHLATSAGPGKARPGELWLRGARRRIGLDPERTSCRRDKSRIHDCILRIALIAGHEGCRPALDERLVRAVGPCVAVRVMSRDMARLDNYDHEARVEMPAREAARRVRDRLHLDVRRTLGLELDPIIVYLDAIGEGRPVGQDRRRES